MSLPRHILDRVTRLYSYHQRTKFMAMGSRYAPPSDPGMWPAPFRVFSDCPKVLLPTSLLDAPVGMLKLLAIGQEAMPDSLRAPPQDLKTLASWLYYAAGGTVRSIQNKIEHFRPFADPLALHAAEIYVAAFSIEGLEPGLYHFSPKEFALRQLRQGAGTLLQIKKGRPDLEFLKTLPAAMLVSGSYWRSVWRYGRRGYRGLLIDVGQAVQNLVVAGAGLGIQTVTRLRMNDNTMRELIGIAPDEPLGSAEAVHSLVAWAERTPRPIELPPRARSSRLEPIPRPSLATHVVEDELSKEVLAVHQDCAAPGVAMQQIRPPLTEMNPLPPTHPATHILEDSEPLAGLAARQVMLERQPTAALARQPIARSHLLAISRSAFRGGSFFPMFPDGQHVAMVRPFWILNEVTGMDRGIYYYDVIDDRWHLLQSRMFRRESRYIAGDSDLFGDAAAVCVIMANLHGLMTQGGPDAYRLAHLEAGITSQRIYLGASSLGLGCACTTDFYDEDARVFFGLGKTGWEALHLVAIGPRADQRLITQEKQANALGQVGMWRE